MIAESNSVVKNVTERSDIKLAAAQGQHCGDDIGGAGAVAGVTRPVGQRTGRRRRHPPHEVGDRCP